MRRPAWSADLSTILGAGLMAGAIVLWFIGRISIGELGAAASIAAVWIGIPQRPSIAHANVTTDGAVTVQGAAVAVAPSNQEHR